MHFTELMHKTRSTHEDTLGLSPFFLQPHQPPQGDTEKKPQLDCAHCPVASARTGGRKEKSD